MLLINFKGTILCHCWCIEHDVHKLLGLVFCLYIFLGAFFVCPPTLCWTSTFIKSRVCKELNSQSYLSRLWPNTASFLQGCKQGLFDARVVLEDQLYFLVFWFCQLKWRNAQIWCLSWCLSHYCVWKQGVTAIIGIGYYEIFHRLQMK